MPELPEISYYKKYVDSTALHNKIRSVHVPVPKLLQTSEKDAEEHLIGTEFTKAIRHGKYLFLESKNGNYLVFHFGMTGKFDFSHEDDPPKYTAFYLMFEDGAKLFFICPRKLGKIYLTESKDDFLKEHSIGKDALDFSKDEFKHLLYKKRGSIKGALTNQSLIAGIGNMYADEMLFQTGIHPKTSPSDLSEDEVNQLYDKMIEVLETVSDRKASGESLPDNYLTGHREPGADCPKSNGKIEMMKISGRSTYFCPACQKEK
ncbi:formamidopyrimidine-DNA glycosylase [Gramella sp. BOM4]|nr:formamidopyrimidine-DNA glycosylase [Christiangramia bathymodioli]